MESRVIVFDDEEGLTAFALRSWKRICTESVAERDVMTAALSGGRTPAALYRALAGERAGLPWEKIRIFVVDERFVPPNDAENNFLMIRETLLDLVPIPQKNIHAIRTDLPSSIAAARHYEEELRAYFHLPAGRFPRFDLILLGLGEDGHTASLFPESPILSDTNGLARAATFGGDRHDRITLTLPVLNNGRHVLFLVHGITKAKALGKVIAEADPTLPASGIKPVPGDLTFLVDRQAASLLPAGSYETGDRA